MTTIQNLFEQAQLAEAAYADLSTAIGNRARLQEALDIAFKQTYGGSFRQFQAAEFSLHWRVIDQYDNTSGPFGIFGTGFSATLFQNTETNAYNLAIRGSTDSTDFSADWRLIAKDGVAIDQLVDMYNHWQSLNTVAGGAYQAAYLSNALLETAQLAPLWAATQIPGALPAILAYQTYKSQLEGEGFVVRDGTVSTKPKGSESFDFLST